MASLSAQRGCLKPSQGTGDGILMSSETYAQPTAMCAPTAHRKSEENRGEARSKTSLFLVLVKIRAFVCSLGVQTVYKMGN